MIFLKEPNTNRIIEFQNENQIGAYFENWERLNLQQSISYELQKEKEKKILKIQENKKALLYSPVEYNGTLFINSEIAGSNLMAAYNFSDEPVTWLDFYGNVVILTKEQMKDIAQLMINRRSLVYFREATLISQVNAINLQEQYFIENEDGGQKQITALQALENINITF